MYVCVKSLFLSNFNYRHCVSTDRGEEGKSFQKITYACACRRVRKQDERLNRKVEDLTEMDHM